jgi:hypothetical protein
MLTMPTEHDTMYPRLKETVAAQDLARVYTPTAEEHTWVTTLTADSTAAVTLGCMLYLKTFQRLGYFVPLHKVPRLIVTHVAAAMGLTAAIPTLAAYQRSGSPSRHQTQILARCQVTPYRAGGSTVVRQAVAEAALHQESLPDLINVAIDALIAQRYELPGFSTLLKVAQRQRTATYTTWYARIQEGLTFDLQAQLDTLFTVDPLTRRSMWDKLKDPAGQPTRKNLQQLADRLDYLATFAPAIQLALTIPEAKRDHFADQARAYNRAVMEAMAAPRRYTLLCVWLQHLQATLLDDLTESVI